MLHSSAEPPLALARSVSHSPSRWTVPWLLSTTAHAAMLVSLALVFHFAQPTWRGTGLTTGMEVTILSSGEGDAGGGGADPMGNDSTSGGEMYYDDEPAPLARDVGPSHQGGGGNETLHALLNEQPAVSLAGVLPTSGTGTGHGGGDGGGIGSAQGLSSEPRGSNRGQGGYARTGVFGVVGEGHKFVYVFDRSGSMDGHGGAPLSAAKRELVGSLHDLGQTHQFQIIFYNEKPHIFTPTGVAGRLVFGTDKNKYLAQKFVGSITADGATRHEEALELALRLSPDVIFFLTDADEPRMTTQQLAHIAHLNHGTSINAIEFGYGKQLESDNFLVRLARQNGGQHVYVDVSQLPVARR